ncbi:MAG: MBL fold metallo-hydrolase [Deltaproteobacteria bacterium]|nr:MBL fold metallo-hydrolase [Deltaproteobacteria bacterium]
MQNAGQMASPTRRRRTPALLLLGTATALLLGGCAGRTQLVRAGAIEVITLRQSHNNAHVVRQGEAMFLVDAGLQRDAAALEERMRDAGIDPAKVRAVVVTHGHADHVGGASHFRSRYGARIIAGAGDRAMLAAGRHEAPLCPTDFLARQRLEQDQGQRYTPLQADVWVDSDPRETVALDLRPLTGVDARVIAMPGHTEGSLIVVAGTFALVGDLFRGSIPGWSATTHFYMCDLADNKRDLRELLEVHAKDATTFFPGHFGPIERASVEALAAEEPPGK